MAFEELKENTENIQEQAQALIENNIAYYKLKAFKLAMKSTSMIFKFTLILLFVCLSLIFFSFALAFAVSKYFESYTYGFLIVGVIYAVITGFLFLVKGRKLIEGTVLEKFSEIFFND